MDTTGQSWDQVRNDWDFPRLESWTRYCKKAPRLRAMVQAYLGIEPPKEPKTVNSDEEVASFLATVAGMPGVVFKDGVNNG